VWAPSPRARSAVDDQTIRNLIAVFRRELYSSRRCSSVAARLRICTRALTSDTQPVPFGPPLEKPYTGMTLGPSLESTVDIATLLAMRRFLPWLQIAVVIAGCQGRLGAPAPAPTTSETPAVEMPPQPPVLPKNPTAIALPIEVLGPNGYSQSVSMFVDQPAEVDRLFLQINRPAFRDSSVNSARKAKGSVQWNQGPWTDFTDKTPGIEIGEPEKSYGGLGGGFHTVRFTLPVTGLVAGWNTLTFRFNETDGVSMGYRVIDLNLLKKGVAVFPATAFSHEDPTRWKPELTSSADIAEGSRLFRQAVLFDPGAKKNLKASCSHCHAADGRDLKYFHFSSWSIEARSTFHGLTALQGKQIASYIRSLPTPAPAQARPWNPPYQPGPGLDSRPVEEWAAGAGLSAVLAKDADMLPYLFPNGLSHGDMKRQMETTGNLNLRELPIALQLPDWNEWLPTTHPIDMWSDFDTQGAAMSLKSARQTLSTRGVSTLIAEKSLHTMLGDTHRATMAYLEKGAVTPRNWRSQESTTIASANGVTREEAKRDLAKWLAVGQWDLIQSFGLEALGKQIFGSNNEDRVWPSDSFSVFQVAPHFVADDISHFHKEQTKNIGKYHSTAWYQLQVTLNAASRQPVNVFPVDWPYQYLHIWQSSFTSGVQHPLRYVASLIKNAQMRDNGLGPAMSYTGFQLRNHQPWLFYSDQCGYEPFMGELDNVKPQLRRQITEALLGSWLDLMERKEMGVASWPRQKTNTESHFFRWVGLERADYVPVPAPVPLGPCDSTYEASENRIFDMTTLRNADSMWRLMPKLKALGIDAALLGRLIEWCKSAWPAGNWDAFRA
jgi:cytochrome c553